MAESRVIWAYQQYEKRVNRNSKKRQYEEQRAERAAAKARKAAEDDGGRSGGLTGIVAAVQRSRCLVAHGESYVPCRIPVRALAGSEGDPVVGDRVAFDWESEGQGVVRRVLPRASRLVRMRVNRGARGWNHGRDAEEQVLAANVDVAVIVASAAAPAFHPRLVDRYLVMCQYGEVAPVVCLNKCDLTETPPDLSTYERMGIPVVYCSAATGQGLPELREQLKGKYSVLTGHSGVGKSSLINRLLGEKKLEVGEVSVATGKGRHTTTTSSLHRLDDNTYLIDTPGIRSLSLWAVERDSIRLYFPDFEQASLRCKFRDCLHLAEPDCGVKEAVERGEVAPERYDSYVRMMNEE